MNRGRIDVDEQATVQELSVENRTTVESPLINDRDIRLDADRHVSEISCAGPIASPGFANGFPPGSQPLSPWQQRSRFPPGRRTPHHPHTGLTARGKFAATSRAVQAEQRGQGGADRAVRSGEWRAEFGGDRA